MTELNKNLWVWFLFSVVSLVGLLNHELWRDELQAWMIARDADSLTVLFQNLKYEGHPGLWHLFLFGITRFTNNPFFMQLFQGLLGLLTAGIICLRSPFRYWQNALICFGYYFLFEYQQMSRNYGLLPLLVSFALWSLQLKRESRVVIFSFIIFLLFQTSIYGVILGLSFSFYVFFLEEKQTRRALTVSCLILLGGLFAFVFQVAPPMDAVAHPTLFDFSWERLLAVISIPIQGLLPIPLPTIHFWETNVLVQWVMSRRELIVVSDIALMIFFLGALLTYFFFLLRTVGWKLLSVVVFTVLGIAVFAYFKFFGSLRHFGHIFMALWVVIWLAEKERASPSRMKLYSGLLFLHMVIGFFAWGVDLREPFSYAKAAAESISQNECRELPLAGTFDAIASPVGGFLNRPIFYPETSTWGSFIVWRDSRNRNMPDEELMSSLRTFFGETGEGFCLLWTHARPFPGLEDGSFEKIAEFKGSIRLDEAYELFKIRFDSVATSRP